MGAAGGTSRGVWEWPLPGTHALSSSADSNDLAREMALIRKVPTRTPNSNLPWAVAPISESLSHMLARKVSSAAIPMLSVTTSRSLEKTRTFEELFTAAAAAIDALAPALPCRAGPDLPSAACWSFADRLS